MRKSERRKKQNNGKKFTLVRWLGVILILAFCFLSFIFFKVIALDKFVYVNKTENGDAEIIIIDNQGAETIKYFIPANTEMNSTRGYGSYKLSSLWVLSEKDENKGKIIAETITKNYSIPISLWKNNSQSNLNLYQRIKAFIEEAKKDNYDFEFKTFNLANSILINFVEGLFMQHVPKIELNDLSGKSRLVENVSAIVENTGGKISSNSKGYDQDLDCLIVAKDPQILKVFAPIFGCEGSINKNISVDVVINLGAKFAERF